MVEMLGVLAIIGVLSIGGIAGYSKAMEKHKLNKTIDEINAKLNELGDGFVKAMWCEELACEEKIKEDTTATSRCMPFIQEKIAGRCVCCGKPATKMVYWGKAY